MHCLCVLTGPLLASLRPKSLILLSSCLQSWLKRNDNIMWLWLTSKNLNFSNKMNSWTVGAHSSYLFYWLVFSLSTQSTQSKGPVCHATSTLFRMLYTKIPPWINSSYRIYYIREGLSLKSVADSSWLLAKISFDKFGTPHFYDFATESRETSHV